MRRRCLAALALTYLALVACLLARGHGALALVVAVPLLLQYRDLAADRLRGATLVWVRGGWALVRRGRTWPLELVRHSRGLPWLLHLDFRCHRGGGRLALWLYRDALEPVSYRRLRVRLALTPQAGIPRAQR